MTRIPQPLQVVLDLRPLQCGYAGKGIGRYTLEMARALAARLLSSPSHRLQSLIFRDRPHPLPSIPAVIEAPPWKRTWLWDQGVLPLLLKAKKVDVFHNFVAMGPLAEVSVPIAAGARTLATLHDLHLFHSDAPDIDRFYRSTRRIRIQAGGIDRIGFLVVDSEQVRDDALSRFIGLRPDRIHVVTLGSDHLDRVKPLPFLKENFLLSIGDTPNKNLPFAYSILDHLRSRFVHLNWVVVGSPERVCAQLGLEPSKIPEWMEIVEAPEDGLMRALYEKALCLLFPSTREGFGIPPLEAMRLGCPVLASDIEPLRSLVGNEASLQKLDGVEGWRVKLMALLYNDHLRREIIAHGLLRSQNHSWSQSAEKLCVLYEAFRK